MDSVELEARRQARLARLDEAGFTPDEAYDAEVEESHHSDRRVQLRFKDSMQQMPVEPRVSC